MKSQWEQPNVVKRYADRRHQPFELVASEQHFFPKVLHNMSSMLDVGCASGGMFNIMHHIGYRGRYIGVDFSEPSIAEARRRYGDRFILADAHHLPFQDFRFPFVHARGLLMHMPSWPVVLQELLRVSRKRLLIDVRFTPRPTRTDYLIAENSYVDFYTITQAAFYRELPTDVTIERFDLTRTHRGTRQLIIESTMKIER